MSHETAVTFVPKAGTILAGAFPSCTPPAADLLSGVVAARDLSPPTQGAALG